MSFDDAFVYCHLLALTTVCILWLLDVVDDRVFWGSYAIIYSAAFVVAAAEGDWAGCAVDAFWFVVAAYLWWRNRRKGGWKRAARELGAKSQARVEALLENMSPSPIPSPVGAS